MASARATGKVLEGLPALWRHRLDYVNGYDKDQGMICRLGCRHRWTADDPEWLAQALPDQTMHNGMRPVKAQIAGENKHTSSQ
jgi:hypothetical protein